METNGILQKHWLGVLVAFATDALVLCFGFLAATQMRLGEEWLAHFVEYLPSIAIAAVVLPCACYTVGLYSPQSAHQNLFLREVVLALCLGVTVAVMLGSFYLNFSGRIGRGVMLIAICLTYCIAAIHHAILLHLSRAYRERVVVLVTSEEDESEAEWVRSLGSQNLVLVGIVSGGSYVPKGKLPLLGNVGDLESISRAERLDRVLCTNRSIMDLGLSRQFCQLRYSGVPVMPLVSLCEEIYHCVPLDLVTPHWLMNASGAPHVFYIKKLKRGFDIICSLLGLLFLGPVMLVGMLLIKLFMPGPVFYRQTRSGRFGKPFQVIKLRSMRVDAEKDGAQWSAENDPRVTRLGSFLRKYRIDEIPQLLNVLKGQMSFVGPRPERPEFVAKLGAEVPFFEERLMVQPGITGWAQVNYPYGASVEDARRKLEYDLYYMKNMSLFLDVFILLDTVRIILRGGMHLRKVRSSPRFFTALGKLPVASPKPDPTA